MLVFNVKIEIIGCYQNYKKGSNLLILWTLKYGYIYPFSTFVKILVATSGHFFHIITLLIFEARKIKIFPPIFLYKYTTKSTWFQSNFSLFLRAILHEPVKRYILKHYIENFQRFKYQMYDNSLKYENISKCENFLHTVRNVSNKNN